MEFTPKFEPIQPRFLRYRNHYKVYLMAFMGLSTLLVTFWLFQIFQLGWKQVWMVNSPELFFSAAFLVSGSIVYFTWLKDRMKRSVQVYPTHLLIHQSKNPVKLAFEDVESVSRVCWSVFYFKMKDGTKFYFNSGLDRVDYVWEGLKNARPDLISPDDYENFRILLVQYDHHQKRKEWFFRHKILDALNWFGLPVFFLFSAYLLQTRDVMIHHPGMYFFRLFMFSLLILLVTTFFFSLGLKKFIFDRKIAEQLDEKGKEKARDMEFEGVILHRSKLLQMVLSCFLFTSVIYSDLNLFSVTKVKDEVSMFDLKKGNSLIVDNRYNCFNCRFQLKDGDLVLFGKGYIGQIMAKGGDMVGEISQDKSGRMIASENVQEVPAGYVAIKSANGSDIVFIRTQELIGKIRRD
ncbi:MAG: hypothetical protein V4598_14510 [Bdellovibrionota bacterium]